MPKEEFIAAALSRNSPPPSAGDWTRFYPVLLGCLCDGRAPSPAEIERLARRIDGEVGTGERSAWTSVDRHDRRRKLLAAARAALLGRRDPPSASLPFPVVLRGH